MKKILVFLVLFFSYSNVHALELSVWDNLRFFLYSPNMLYNKGVDLYSKGDYEKSTFYFNMVKCKTNSELCAKKFYNSGNANYRIGEKAIDSDLKQVNWENAIKDYSESLKHKFDDEVKQNLEFVFQKLNELKKKKEEEKNKKQEEDKKNQKQKEENGKQDKDERKEKKEDKKTEEIQKGEEKKEQARNDKNGQESSQIVKNQSMGLGGDETSVQKLTPDEAKQLEEYYQSLKNDERQNQEFFNKKNNNREESPFDQFLSPFRFFRGDPFFDEIGGNSGEKDW